MGRETNKGGFGKPERSKLTGNAGKAPKGNAGRKSDGRTDKGSAGYGKGGPGPTSKGNKPGK